MRDDWRCDMVVVVEKECAWAWSNVVAMRLGNRIG